MPSCIVTCAVVVHRNELNMSLVVQASLYGRMWRYLHGTAAMCTTIIRMPPQNNTPRHPRHRLHVAPVVTQHASPDSKVHGVNMGPSGTDRTQVGPMLAPWILLSGSAPNADATRISAITEKQNKKMLPHHIWRCIFWYVEISYCFSHSFASSAIAYCSWPFVTAIISRVTLYTAGHLHTAVPHCSHSRAPIVHTAVPPLFTQPCPIVHTAVPHCSHSRAPGEQWARLWVFTLQGCLQAAWLCRGSPVYPCGILIEWITFWLNFGEWNWLIKYGLEWLNTVWQTHFNICINRNKQTEVWDPYHIRKYQFWLKERKCTFVNQLTVMIGYD